ncbi:hypothetical protein VTK73DRAFT_9976 [Phialemonium thermophilum]|uniref:Uncharacterized protein n=1 Tax=Phialemonium thermophilum TaxID=223376 RepID=A0ABR3VZ27_9PEZI
MSGNSHIVPFFFFFTGYESVQKRKIRVCEELWSFPSSLRNRGMLSATPVRNLPLTIDRPRTYHRGEPPKRKKKKNAYAKDYGELIATRDWS